MQSITPELQAILKDRLQAGPSGFRGRVEIDTVLSQAEGGDPDTHQAAWNTATSYLKPAYRYDLASGLHEGSPPASNITDADSHTESDYGDGVWWTPGRFWRGFVVDLEEPLLVSRVSWQGSSATWVGGHDELAWEVWSGDTIAGMVNRAGSVVGDLDGWTYWGDPAYRDNSNATTFILDTPTVSRYWHFREYFTVHGLEYIAGIWCYGMLINGVPPEGTISYSIETIQLPQPSRVAVDKSLTTDADQAECDFPNEDQVFGWGTDTIFKTNSRIRIYQWYGDVANELLTFTGVIDDVIDHRDPLTTTIKARDMMAVLIDPTFGATAPQGADEEGAVRTEANGVFLSREVSYIVNAILDLAGWPAADRDVQPTNYVLDEYIVQDGWRLSDAIIGADRLAGLVGYSAWADEFGIFHFEATFSAGSLTDPPAPVYTFTTGVDITSLDRETDQYELRTRVKVRGPLTTQTLTDTWRELWRTSKLSYPVGIWYDPTDSANIRVIDRGTKNLYRIRQSDRVVLSYVYLGALVPYPVGLSGDPADSNVYWILNAPWLWGSSATPSVKKFRKSDNHLLATYNLPGGHWSAIKVSADYIWLTNLSTDRFYKRSKANASAIADYRHTYGGNLQSNPSGIMIDGTTLHLFWNNSGTTARFLICSESAPETITKAISTAGTVLVGGEMDTTTHTECWGDSDSLHLLAKFTLVEVADQTDQVYAEAVDTALEDELGMLAQLQPREHDTHLDAPPHAYEVRRDTLDVSVVTSLAQATETAVRRLELISRRREILDAGILGNPALQKNDVIRVVDPLVGTSRDWQIDTHRSLMGSTYLGTLALFPLEVADDSPVEEGELGDTTILAPDPVSLPLALPVPAFTGPRSFSPDPVSVVLAVTLPTMPVPLVITPAPVGAATSVPGPALGLAGALNPDPVAVGTALPEPSL